MALEFVPSLGSLLSYGSNSTMSKIAINQVGRHKTAVYAYAMLVFLLLAGVIFLQVKLQFPVQLLIPYAIEVAMGAIGAIAAYKALDYGKASTTTPVGRIYVLLVLAGGAIFFGEVLSATQLTGALLILVASGILSFHGNPKLKLEPWMGYLAISIACRAYYYTFIKTFVTGMGAYEATVFLELGITAFTVAYHLFRGRDILPKPGEKVVAATASGAMIFAGSALYSLSVASIGAGLTAAISAGSPIVNAVLSHFLLKEKMDLQKYAATLILVIGLVLIATG